VLNDKLKLGGIGFRGDIRKSVLLEDISKLKGVGRIADRKRR